MELNEIVVQSAIQAQFQAHAKDQDQDQDQDHDQDQRQDQDQGPDQDQGQDQGQGEAPGDGQTQDPTQGEAIDWAFKKLSWLRCCEASAKEEISVELAVIVVEPANVFVNRPKREASSDVVSSVELGEILLEPGADWVRKADGEDQQESEGGVTACPGKKFRWRWWSESVEHSVEPAVASRELAPGFVMRPQEGDLSRLQKGPSSRPHESASSRPQEGASSRPQEGASGVLEDRWREWTLEDLESHHI